LKAEFQVPGFEIQVRLSFLNLCLMPLIVLVATTSAMKAQQMEWSKLPPLPDKEGFAAMYAGVSGDALVVAGGANFPEKRPWEGGTKMWYDDVWVLDQPDGAWRKAGKLPKSLGYGVSVNWKGEVICIGGSNADGHDADVFSLSIEGQGIVVKQYPPLPRPCANFCGALVGDTIFVAGGIEKPDSVQAMHTFWSLKLSQDKPQWRELTPWPGKERMLATAAAHDGAFYLFSGAALHAGSDGKPEREWLKDSFRYREGVGWEKLPDAPRVAVAAVSPAPVTGNTIFLLAGDDGAKVGFKPETQHPGFPLDQFVFDTTLLQWTTLSSLAPFSRATVPSTRWREGFIVPSGEARPGYRSNEVWMLNLR
jgi:N-acetylneuraminate epimerase